MYSRGQGIPRDDAEAIRWYRLAAEEGNPEAKYSLGVMYSKGQGTPQDYTEAIFWFKQLADEGDPDAQYNLGVLYWKGQGVPADLVQAYAWFSVSAADSAGEAHERASTARDVVASILTPEQLAQAKKAAADWKPAGTGAP